MTDYALDPDAVLDYKFDWTAWLGAGETITTKTVIGTAGITVDSSVIVAGAVTVWVSAGVVGTQRVTCRITTNQGRTDDRTIVLRVRGR